MSIVRAYTNVNTGETSPKPMGLRLLPPLRVRLRPAADVTAHSRRSWEMEPAGREEWEEERVWEAVGEE